MKTQNSGDCHSSGRRRHAHHGRKERVLHTRISEQLSEDIRNFAADLRVPASNLVRNVLEEVFTVVDGVSDDVGDLFDDLIEEAEGIRERVREQANSSPRRRHAGMRRRRRRSRRREGDFDQDADVEAEFRRDEVSEEEGMAGASADGSGTTDESSTKQAQPRAAELFPDILGWQPLVLNRDFECGRCKRNLTAGESAFLGLAEKGLTQTALCGRCAGSR